MSLFIETIANDDTDGFFPNTLPDDVYNFSTEYTPPIMQGNGYYVICFNTDSNASKFNELGEDGYSIDFYVDVPKCIENSPDTTEVHIINSNFYWNHPHTDIIFINYDEKMICFSSVG